MLPKPKNTSSEPTRRTSILHKRTNVAHQPLMQIKLVNFRSGGYGGKQSAGLDDPFDGDLTNQCFAAPCDMSTLSPKVLLVTSWHKNEFFRESKERPFQACLAATNSAMGFIHVDAVGLYQLASVYPTTSLSRMVRSPSGCLFSDKGGW